VALDLFARLPRGARPALSADAQDVERFLTSGRPS
jgi:hypothetical protein